MGILVAFLMSSAIAAPQNKFDGDTSFGEVMQTLSDDTLQLLNTKAKIVQFVGKSTANAALGGVGHAVNTAFDGVDYATKSLEASALNRTEMAIIKKKKAMIEGVFGLKRRAMKAMAGFWNDSVNSIHNAAAAVHNGIESIHNGIDNGIESIHNGIDEAASQITIENAQGIISNTTLVVSGGVDTAVGTVENTFQIAGNSILSHVSETKQGLHDALENFDSQKLFNKGAQKIESAVKATGNGLEYVGKRLNLFNALNNIAKLKSKVPNYVLVQTGQLQPAKQEQTGTI